MKTRLVGVSPLENRSIADKLPTQWRPYYGSATEQGLREGHLHIKVSEEEIKDAYQKVSNIIHCEPSAAATFSALSKLNMKRNDKVIVINSGKGLEYQLIQS